MHCRACDATDLDLVLDLGEQPWCNHFLKQEEIGQEPVYPLRLVYCNNCTTTQLDYTVRKEVMFGDHTYLSGVTKSLSEHFRKVAAEVNERVRPAGKTPSVLDIGSNDGTQLIHFKAMGYDVVGVESSKTTARIAQDAGIETVNAFFNRELSKSLGRKFDVINAAGVFFHLEELHSVTDGIKHSLADDGLFVVQFLYMKSIVENLAFDQIYHEHLLYYNLKNIGTLLARHGLALFDAYLAPIHGGSMIGFVSHADKQSASARLQELRHIEEATHSNDIETYREFARRIDRMKSRDVAFLRKAKMAGKTIYGLGAPVKGNTLLNYFQIGPETLTYLVEKNPLRRGLYSPGMHIPVVLENELARDPDIYYVLAWNFRKEILANNQALLDRGVKFYFPVQPVQAEAA